MQIQYPYHIKLKLMMFLNLYSLEKTGVKNESIVRLLTVLPFIGIRRLSLASLGLAPSTIVVLINVINQSGDVMNIKELNL